MILHYWFQSAMPKFLSILLIVSIWVNSILNWLPTLCMFSHLHTTLSCHGWKKNKHHHHHLHQPSNVYSQWHSYMKLSLFLPCISIRIFFSLFGDPTVHFRDATPVSYLLVIGIPVSPSLHHALFLWYSPQYLEHPKYKYS